MDEHRFQEALALRDAGDLQAARDILLDLTQADGTSAAAFAVLGGIYWTLKDLDRAIPCFEEAIGLAPKAPVASLGLFHCLWEQGRINLAIAEMKRFMAVSDSSDYRMIISEMMNKWVNRSSLDDIDGQTGFPPGAYLTQTLGVYYRRL